MKPVGLAEKGEKGEYLLWWLWPKSRRLFATKKPSLYVKNCVPGEAYWRKYTPPTLVIHGPSTYGASL